MGRMAFPFLLLAVTACQTAGPGDPLKLDVNKPPRDAVVAVGIQAQKCWFKSGDPVFQRYRLANEVNSFSGRPRVLLVPRARPGDLPSLVVEARAGSAAGSSVIQAFGPLVGSKDGARIIADVKRWALGSKSCKA